MGLFDSKEAKALKMFQADYWKEFTQQYNVGSYYRERDETPFTTEIGTAIHDASLVRAAFNIRNRYGILFSRAVMWEKYAPRVNDLYGLEVPLTPDRPDRSDLHWQ